MCKGEELDGGGKKDTLIFSQTIHLYILYSSAGCNVTECEAGSKNKS